MNVFWSVFLGVGGTGGILSITWTIYKDVTSRQTQEEKAEGEIKLDTTTEKRIAAEAAQINSDVAIAQQNWWKDQFESIRAELTEEQNLRRKLSIWARQHQAWDEAAWMLAVQSDPTYPPPPRLEDLSS